MSAVALPICGAASSNICLLLAPHLTPGRPAPRTRSHPYPPPPASLAVGYALSTALSTRILESDATASASCTAAGISPAAVGEPAAVDGQSDSGDVGRSV
jgi:hypothetical protein